MALSHPKRTEERPSRRGPGRASLPRFDRWIATVLALAAAVCLGFARAEPGALAAAPASQPDAAAAKADAELASLRDFLVGSDRTMATRRDAADVLLDKDTPAALAVLVELLSGTMPSDAKLAILDAIAARQTAHPAFLDPLFQLLRSDDEATRRAAAAAFGAYQGSDRAFLRLKELATAGEAPSTVRLAAIQAMARLVDKRSIETLVRLTADAKPPVAAAAAEALADMTGLKDIGASPFDPLKATPSLVEGWHEAWAEWWKAHEQQPESLLLAGLLRRSREEAKRCEAAMDRLQARLIRHLKDLYEAADAKQKVRLAMEHLDDSVPQVRALGASQAANMAHDVLGAGNGGARQGYQELIASLTKRVNDESPAVRSATAEALAAWKEAAAAPVLLARLDAEKSPEVRAALAAALGGLKVIEAVPKLITMLDSSNEVEVLRAAGALGAIGEKGSPGSAAVEPAAKALGRLVRSAPQPSVREAACLALAKIAPPSAEEVLAMVLDDPTPSVRFGAAQGIGNLPKVGDRTVASLAARLQDENKGVRQAAAAALARLGGPEAARKMADRLKVGAETEPAVRNALWAAVKALVDRSASPDLAQELGDRFFAREGAEEVQHAAAMYEAALAKMPAADRAGQAAQVLYEKLVDAYVAAGTPESAIPPLRQLLLMTPAENVVRVRELNQQLGVILLAREPYTDAVPCLAAGMKGAAADDRLAIVKAVQARTEALLKADRPEQALKLLDVFGRAQPDGGADLAALGPLRAQATDATVARAIAKLGGPEDQAAAAVATLKTIGRPASLKLLDALEADAKGGRRDLEVKVPAAIEAVTGRNDHGYVLQAPLEERLGRIEAWRKAL